MSLSQQLMQVLLDCLAQSKVNEATIQLLRLSKLPTFLETLLGIIFEGINDEPTLIMALTTYKNYLKQYYSHQTEPMSQANKKLARDTCQQLYFKIASSNVAINVYKEILAVLVEASYPWPGLDLTKLEQIQPNSYIFGQIGQVYEYSVEDKKRQVLEKTVDQYYPMLQGLVKQILENYNQKTARVLTEYFEMFYCAMHMQLPNRLKNLDTLQTWVLYLKSVLNYQIPPNAPLNQNHYLQNQIAASKIILNFVYQHCKQSSQDLQWVHAFINNFIADIFSTTVSLLFSKKHELHEDVLANLIRTLYSGYKNPLIRPLIINLAERILFEEMLPLVDFKSQDVEYFTKDPLQFIRRQEDNTVNPVRWAAIDLIKVLIYLEFEGKGFLIRFMQHSVSVLMDSNANPMRKATVMLLISKLKTEVLHTKSLQKQFGQLLNSYFVPYLSDQNPLLIYSACSILQLYLVDVSLQQSIVQQLFAKLYDCLNHSSAVVRFVSVLAFTSLLQDDSEAIQFVKPHFQTILKIYLGLIQQMDHQSLLKALQKIIKYFDKEILSVGPQLIKHLITMFYKYAEKDQQDDEPGFIQNPTSASLSTIRQLLALDLDQTTYFELSKDIIEMLVFVTKKILKNCYEQIYDLFLVLVHKSQQISDFVFPYLLFRKVLDGTSYQTQLECEYSNVIGLATQADISYFETVLAILKNLIVKMPREILFAYPLPTTPDLILCLIQNKILTSEQLTSMDTSQVTGNWAFILQSYSAVLYEIGTVYSSIDFIKGFPTTISFYPWLMTVSDLNTFLAIIKRVLSRSGDDDDTDQDQGQLTTMQMLQKYAQEDKSDEQDYQDAYVDEQASYSYSYDSPFNLKNDLVIINQKLSKLPAEMRQQLMSKLGKNESCKLQRLLMETGQGN